MRKLAPTLRLAAGLAALALSAAACGGGGSGAGGSASEESGGTITLGIIPSWTDGLSTAYLWKDVLEQQGYKVEIQGVSDAAPLYAGVANGDIDVYPSAWPEVTHKSYMEEFGDDLEDLGAYYDEAKLTIAVPKYTDISSIADLQGKSEMFDGRIVGIEPGAGLTEATKESVIPQYGLGDSYELVTSSTTAMLAELQKATKSKDDIVVTLWRPFWANSEFPVKDLEDPKGALGPSEGLHAIATEGFSEEFPEVAKMMGSFELNDQEYGQLEDMVVNEYGEGKEAQAVDAWLKQNPDFVKSVTG
jgi:glycine betaine/proline transport system substrate-binding protein